VSSTELGRVLRRWRERVAPEAVGLPVGPRRRAAGLRREELAGLAAISADYLTRLEQGRASSPSVQVVESLVRALRLDDTERALLFHLAGHVPPGPDVVCSRVTPSVQRLLDRLADTPVAVYDATWTLVEANAPYDALMGDTTGWRGIERNAVWRHLVGPGTRARQTPEEKAELEAGVVADLRLTASRYPGDPGRPARPAATATSAGARSSSTPTSGRSRSTATPSSSRPTTCASWSSPPSPAPRTPNVSPSPSCSAPRPSPEPRCRRAQCAATSRGRKVATSQAWWPCTTRSAATRSSRRSSRVSSRRVGQVRA
jgi:transcriptional regulator with XRE-family HTH domain